MSTLEQALLESWRGIGDRRVGTCGPDLYQQWRERLNAFYHPVPLAGNFGESFV